MNEGIHLPQRNEGAGTQTRIPVLRPPSVPPDKVSFVLSVRPATLLPGGIYAGSDRETFRSWQSSISTPFVSRGCRKQTNLLSAPVLGSGFNS